MFEWNAAIGFWLAICRHLANEMEFYNKAVATKKKLFRFYLECKWLYVTERKNLVDNMNSFREITRLFNMIT